MFQNTNKKIKFCENIMLASFIFLCLNIFVDKLITHSHISYSFSSIIYLITGLSLSFSIFSLFYFIGIDNDQRYQKEIVEHNKLPHKK